MAFNYEYPYTDPNRYNSDWLLRTVRELESVMREFTANNTIKYMGDWSIEKYYTAYSVVLFENSAYLSIRPVAQGVDIMNKTYWVKILDGDYVYKELSTRIANIESGLVEISKEVLLKNVTSYATATDMVNNNPTVDSLVFTRGYYMENDGGNAAYFIREQRENDVVSALYETSEQGLLLLKNGNVAVLVDGGIVNVLQYGIKSDGETPFNTKLDSIIKYDRANGNVRPIYFPSGEYMLDMYMQSIRQEVTVGIIDLQGLVIYGDGENTKIHGVSATGFDVFQLNGVSNISIHDLSIDAKKTTTDTTNGVNGISITNGSNNIMIERVYVDNLPYVVKDQYVDGGKGITLQNSGNNNGDIYNVKISDCVVTNSPSGIWLDFLSNDNSAVARDIIITSNTLDVWYHGITVSTGRSESGKPKESPIIITNNIVNNAVIAVDLSRVCGCIVSGNTLSSKIVDIPQQIIALESSAIPIRLSACFLVNVINNNVDYLRCREMIAFNAYALTGDCTNCNIISNNFKSEVTSGYAFNTYSYTGNESGGYPEKCVFAFNMFTDGVVNPIINYHTLHNLTMDNNELRIDAIKAMSIDLITTAGTRAISLTQDGTIATNGYITGAVAEQTKKLPIYDLQENLIGYIPIYNS